MIENKNLVLFYAISHTFEKFRRSLAGYRHLYSQRCVPQPCWTFKGGMRLSGTQFAILYFATLSIFMFSIPVRSQTSADYSPGNIAPPAEKYTISPGGVDMRTGHYVYRNMDLTIGTGVSDGGLKLDLVHAGHFPFESVGTMAAASRPGALLPSPLEPAVRVRVSPTVGVPEIGNCQ